jgi:23S rRNA (uracil1939-C5)-methyltransferase
MKLSAPLTISHVGHEGDGVAVDPDDVRHIVIGALPGEVYQDGVRQTESADRIAPICPHYGPCGGCQVQHWAVAPYLAWKRQGVEQALAHQGIVADVAETFAVPVASRRRVALHARQIDGAVVLGFKGRKSWDVVNVHSCAVMHPQLVAALDGLRALAVPLFIPKAAPVLHVTVTQTGLDVDISGVPPMEPEAQQQVIAAARAMSVARLSRSGAVWMQLAQPVVMFGDVPLALPPGSFLQASAEAEAEMARQVLTAVGSAKRVADLFCGVGTFALRLAGTAQVLAADSTPAAIAALKRAAQMPGLKPVTADVRDLFRNPILAKDLRVLDAVVLDPPRAGAEAQVREIAKSMVKTVVYVSCNAQSFARDARILLDAGYTLKTVAPIDQFVWSSHVELVATLRFTG